MRICPFCPETEGTASHVRWCKENPKRDQYLEKLKKARSDKESYGRKGGNQYTLNPQFQMSEETRKKLREANIGRTHSEESKEKISRVRIQWLKDHPDLHPWKKPRTGSSVPCEKLKSDLLLRGHVFEEEITPSNNRFFCVDILFRKEQLIIEVNGNQHYTDTKGTLKHLPRKT